MRSAQRGPGRELKAGECHRCGYLGWARTTELTELSRKALRERPPHMRRLRAVA